MSGGPVDEFLAELGRHLRRDVATRERVVAELADHLRDLVAEGRASGLDELTAELEAVERFGSPRALARGLRPARTRTPVVCAATALAGAAFCGALVFATTRPGPSIPRAGQAVATGCVFVVTPSTAPGAHQVLAATRIAIDPRYGAIRRCHALTGGTVIVSVSSGAPAPVETAFTHDVSMATAMHQ
jgi:hypothetical protein